MSFENMDVTEGLKDGLGQVIDALANRLEQIELALEQCDHLLDVYQPVASGRLRLKVKKRRLADNPTPGLSDRVYQPVEILINWKSRNYYYEFVPLSVLKRKIKSGGEFFEGFSLVEAVLDQAKSLMEERAYINTCLSEINQKFNKGIFPSLQRISVSLKSTESLVDDASRHPLMAAYHKRRAVELEYLRSKNDVEE